VKESLTYGQTNSSEYVVSVSNVWSQDGLEAFFERLGLFSMLSLQSLALVSVSASYVLFTTVLV